MPRYMIQSQKEELNRIEPIIKRMNPERARQMAAIFDSLVTVAESMKALSSDIEDSEELDDAEVFSLSEGLNQEDSTIFREWLTKKAETIQSVYELIPLDQRELFNQISITAQDVYNDAMIAEEEKREAEAEIEAKE